jgi:hypothetical protein
LGGTGSNVEVLVALSTGFLMLVLAFWLSARLAVRHCGFDRRGPP